MAPRLKAMPSLLPAAPSALPSISSDWSKKRDQAVSWRKWYHTARWQKLRKGVLVRDLFTCQRCGRIEGNTSLLVADHKEPHRGDETLFWDAGNLQCLCQSCHSSDKQQEERRL
ncbi:HNH endonuclease [Falsirhodobacter halotolerans]|uniref:HNH endonuclease n=1 Tax=Falsirhodobacter halotolerans TaxID=1146892 RepID=UPI001FD0F46B|nr:HNH endonuclease signature motif containing protein [Falsirhodobacter halotolerans]MCJ8138421.1 HNH endonuclease [Falsirhodobacter halotolerans]